MVGRQDVTHGLVGLDDGGGVHGGTVGGTTTDHVVVHVHLGETEAGLQNINIFTKNVK